nr:hypothetical protein [Tanacetum cinerariifolium]
ILAQDDDVQEHAEEEVATNVVSPTPTSPSPSSPVIPSHSPPQLQAAEGSSHVFQQVLSMQEDDTEVQEAVEVVTTAKLITKVVTATATQVVAASTPISAAKPKTLKIDAAAHASREEMEKEDEEIIKSINETPAQEAAKRRKLSEEAQEADDFKKRLEIIQDEDDDVFVKATPLAQKVPVVDYQVVVIDNKPSIGEKMEAADLMWCTCDYTLNSSALLIS